MPETQTPLDELDRQIAATQTRVDELTIKVEQITEAKEAASVLAFQLSDQLNTGRVNALAQGLDFSVDCEDLGEQLKTASIEEANLARDLLDHTQAISNLRRDLVRLDEKRREYISSQVHPKYKELEPQVEDDYLTALANAMVVAARVNGVAVFGVNPDRVGTRILEKARRGNTLDGYLKIAMDKLAQEYGA